MTWPGAEVAFVRGRQAARRIAKQVVKIAHLNKTRSNGFMEALAETAPTFRAAARDGHALPDERGADRHFEIALNASPRAETRPRLDRKRWPMRGRFWNQFLTTPQGGSGLCH